MVDDGFIALKGNYRAKEVRYWPTTKRFFKSLVCFESPYFFLQDPGIIIFLF